MAKRMLIDAAHAEETRAVIINGHKLEEFDIESSTKKQLKGNIYLAKVIRIEPSLQAAFVEFGGTRHGFLPFSEIHPDYFRIPVEDRQQLLKEHEEALAAQAEEDGSDGIDTNTLEAMAASNAGESFVILGEEAPKPAPQRERKPRTVPLYKRYKIQEVIKRRQVMLVQVVKEERGGKGAALTTNLSLAGRYCVLMPNSPRSGGVSRKITSVTDRKRLRSIIDEIELPLSMSLIVRTAGMARTKPEIKRDCEYLTACWNDIRELTMKSTAPALIYEEAGLIKRCIRDLYDKDITEILIEGEASYKEAKDFMKLLVPTHAKKVKLYHDEKLPLFHKYGVEDQLATIHNPTVQLKSGGYIVFGTTEALVAIDVNSGKATRERHIDDTAFKTNLEAADEVARQLRLRDLAGLVVIDFIDMDDSKHVDAVERRLREAMRDDRARTQVGNISMFGLMELSRQRLRPNIIESSSLPCAHCHGTGMVRSVSSTALQVLRAIEEEAMNKKCVEILVHAPLQVAIYLLNEKRKMIRDIEAASELQIGILPDESLISPDFRIERLLDTNKAEIPQSNRVNFSESAIINRNVEDEEDEVVESEAGLLPESVEPRPQSRNRPRRSRFGRGRKPQGDDAPRPSQTESSSETPAAQQAVPSDPTAGSLDQASTDTPKGPRRRSNRGRRGRGRGRPEGQQRSDAESGHTGANRNETSMGSTSPVATGTPRQEDAGSQTNTSRTTAGKSEMAGANPSGRKHETTGARHESTGARQDSAGSNTAPRAEDSSSDAKSRKGWWQRLLD